jgi:ferritin-like metal-binding protein YciE
MYDVERKLTEVLPQLAQECQDPQVSSAFLEHQSAKPPARAGCRA